MLRESTFQRIYPHISVLSRVWAAPHTAVLFTRSDILTIVVPTLAFSTVSTGDFCLTRILYRFLWVWLNLLQFCISNQTHSIEEDRINKPWRPLPAGRISPKTAGRLRWILLPVCLAISSLDGTVFAACAVLTAATLAHNDRDLGANWRTRNLLNAVGYAAFNIGAAFISSAPSYRLRTLLAVQLINSSVILTTIHAQDFKDVDGDRRIGRSTMPIAYPKASRIAVVAFVPAWTLVLCCYWHVSTNFAAAFAISGLYVGVRFARAQTLADDKCAYRCYNVWLCMMHAAAFMGTRGPIVY
ncbi:UbiA prenyltransferase family-domain-containing protein [Trametes maxima]|nr:UbiA prenyltransferase family-domain-containing protein [Trametes maxima]